MNIAILPEQVLLVMWTPALDADISPITYHIRATTLSGMRKTVSESVEHPITMATLNGLPQYSTVSISLRARNPGGYSKRITQMLKMMNVTGEGRLFLCDLAFACII